MQKIWVSGAKGQIGKAINAAVDKMEYEMLNTDVEYLDITDIDEVLKFADMNRPGVIINCAGLMDTKVCEASPADAYRVNALGARNLSVAAQKLQARLVQVSTDDVFDGKSAGAYNEYDTPAPVSVYGRSKLAGENYVKEFTARHFIIRSTWVYGQGENFVRQLLRKVKSGESVSIAADHYGSPTSAADLADFILTLIRTNEYGTFHATGRGHCSRYEFAQEILRLAGLTADMRAVPKAESDFSADRPDSVVLDNFVLSMLSIYTFPDWKESLSEYMKREGA